MLVLGALSLVLAASTALAQDKPNFAGTWTRVEDPNAAGGGGGRGGRGGLGAGATIAQDAKTLTVTRTTQAGEIKTVYNLDGSESKNMMNMRGGQVEQVSKAAWEGNKLVITTSYDMGGNMVTTTQSFMLDGATLVVESTSPGRGGGAPVTTTTRYTKS
jgi:hypothetical protein